MFDKDNLRLPKHWIIAAIIFLIIVGGYILYFHAKSQITQKDREYEILKEKTTQAQARYDDLKNKYDGTT